MVSDECLEFVERTLTAAVRRTIRRQRWWFRGQGVLVALLVVLAGQWVAYWLG